MAIFIFTVLLFFNALFAATNYELKYYKTAMFNAFVAGACLVMLFWCLSF